MATLILRRERVYDPVLRVIHAWNALLLVLLLLSSQLASRMAFDWPVPALWRLHLWLGYLFFIGLTARFIWGLVGPKSAHWRDLWHPAAWLAGVRGQWRRPPGSGGWGHLPQATLAYLVFYILAWVMVITGLALAAIDQGAGPLYQSLGYDYLLKAYFRLPHEWLQYVFMAFLGVHLAALILHERRHGVPIAQGMVSGYQYRKEE